MTVTEMKAQLELLEQRGMGEFEISTIVRDYYTTQGEFGTLRKIDADSSFGGGLTINSSVKEIRFTVDLMKDYDGKQPKITFRKG